MARTMNMRPDAPVYRAVITKKYRGSEPYVSYEGPYSTAAAAKARVTYWENYLASRVLDIDGSPLDETWAKGVVEVGTVTWTKLD